MDTLFGLREEDIPSLKPTFHTTTPYKKQPQSNDIELYVRNFYSGLSIWPSKEYKTRFLQSDTESVVAYNHPYAARDHLIKPASVWFAFYFFLDDLCDADQVSDGLNLFTLLPLVCGDKTPENGNPFEEAVFEIKERCRAACAGDAVYNYELDKKMRAGKDQASRNAFATIDEFLEHRRAAFGGLVAIPCTRWICDVRLPQAILEDRRIRRIEELSIFFGTLVDDVSSLRKELKGMFKKGKIDGNFACLNAVIWWAEKEKISIRDAMRVIEKKIEALENEFKAAVEEFMSADDDALFGREHSRAARDYIESIVWFVGGNFGWHASCGRYNNLDLY